MHEGQADSSGFTLVELVTVLIIIGILGTGVITFIGDSTNGFAATVAREKLAEDGQYIAEKFTREIRDALPNSVRANTNCLELVHIAGGSKYHTLPLGGLADGMYSWPIDPTPTASGLRVAVYPQSDLYDGSTPGSISPPTAINAPETDNRVRLTFDAPFQFIAGSPRSNYYLVEDPVSYCTSNGNLYRYTNYGYQASQPTAATLPSTLPTRALEGEGVSATFSVSPASLQANSIVNMVFEVSARGETVRINHLAHVRNAP